METPEEISMISKQTQQLILASSSPRRQELIRMLGFPVEFVPANVDESYDPDLMPAAIVESLSLRKAEKVVADRILLSNRAVVVGSDTLVAMDNRIFGKPVDAADAFRMLHLLQGKKHQVFTGVACISLVTGKQVCRHRVTHVTMKALTDSQIKAYIATGESDDKAGAYGIQGLGATIVTSIEGDYFNVVGLPLSLLSDMLVEYDMHVL